MTAVDEAAQSEDRPLDEVLASYLGDRLEVDGPVAITDMTRIAVGWSHETWLFDAMWTTAGCDQRQGFCLRRDPGNALLRHESDLAQQFRVLQCLEATDVPAPRAFWLETEGDALGRPALIMERVPGECPSPWRKTGREYYAAA
ncbi:MAG: phosphotransferase, partial [Acidimicrobiales bacterium]